MRFNKQELITLASQPSHKFDREGILILKERQDGFFRRTESTKSDHSKSQKDGKREKLKNLSCVGVSDKVSLERWCRLRGNLLFYLRAAEQWAEPLGVIVLEQCSVRTSPEDHSGHWPFQIVWDGGTCQQMAALTEADRIGWLQAIQLATYECMRSQMLALQDRLEKKRGTDPDIDIHMWRLQKGLTMDINEVPLCELSLSCDNLLCDAHGQPPSPLLVIHIKTVSDYWIRYSSTEVIEKSSNPSFFSTVSFRGSDSLDGNTKVRVTVYDMREKVSNTAVPMGSAVVLLSTIQDTQRLRIPLASRENSTIGFLTLNGWSLEPSNHGSSPQHTSDLNGAKSIGTTSQRLFSHRRSQSLPPRLGVKLKLPSHGSIMKHICANPYQVTYRFHSGLGGDITVHEIMAESKLCFTLPQQLLSLWIQREKELLQEVLCMGELGGPWRARQTELLDTHLSLLKYYSHARQNLQNHSTTINSYKQSSRKADPYLEFAPVNLHIQRMWVHNDTLSKSGFYDLITVGAFTAHCQKFGRSGGLFRLVQQMKNIPPQKNASVPSLDSRIQMASDAVHAIKQLRGEVVGAMRGLLTLAKARQPAGMMPLADQMVAKTRALLSLWDPGQVEEALAFIDKHKLTPAQDLEDTKSTRPKVLSPFKQLTQQLSLLDLKSPEIEDFATPSTPQNQWPNPAHNNPTILSSSVPNYSSIFNAQNFAEKSKSSLVSENNKNPLLPKHSPKNVNRSGLDSELTFHHQYFVDDSDERLRLGEFRSYNYCIDENAECMLKSDNSHNFAFANLKNNHQFASLNIKQSFDISTQKNDSSSIESSLTVNDKESIHSNVTPIDLDGNGVDHKELECASFSDESASGILGCNNDIIAKQFLDIHAMSSSPSANYYQPNDEPEPWDLTQLNVEASVMCLVSKVKFLCGRCGSPAVRLRGQSVSMSACSSGFKRVSKSGINSDDKSIVTNQPHTGKSSSTSILSEAIRNNIRLDKLSERAETNFKKIDHGTISPEYTHIPLKGAENVLHSSNGDETKQKIASSAVIEADEALNKTVESVNRVMKKGNKFTDGLVLADVSDWAAELRPSMRKLRQAMDGLLKGGRLAHAVLRVRGPSQQQAVALQLRRDVCFSQALTSLITGLVCWVWSTDPETIGALLKAGMGPLCCVQGLLSLHGAELPMWGDMLIAVEDLRTVLFQLATWDHRRNVMPQISGSRFSIVVTIPAPANVYAQLPNKQTASFTITPVFFNIGINEKATIAESFGSTGPQDRSNADNFERLNEYYLRFRKLSLSSNHVITRVSSGLRPLVEVMESLKSAVYSRTSKNVEVLHLASHAVRQMNGIRITSCKSAKDRTGMSCTLEQCQILATEYHLAEHEFNRALDCMRSEGCRRENTYKNTGVRKYAFNKLQIMSLPKAYRPPSGTYGSAQT